MNGAVEAVKKGKKNVMKSHNQFEIQHVFSREFVPVDGSRESHRRLTTIETRRNKMIISLNYLRLKQNLATVTQVLSPNRWSDCQLLLWYFVALTKQIRST